MIPVKLNIKTFIKFEAKSSVINSHFEEKAKMLKHFAVPLSSQGKKSVRYIMCYKLDRVGHGDDIIKCVERWIKAVDYLEQKGGEKKKEKKCL